MKDAPSPTLITINPSSYLKSIVPLQYIQPFRIEQIYAESTVPEPSSSASERIRKIKFTQLFFRIFINLF